MGFFSRMSPARAYKDLRQFLATRERHEFWFLVAAMAVTGFLIFAFYKDSNVPAEYKRDIIYVQQWPADRTDAQIRAQQAIDAPIKARQMAELKAAEERRRAGFKRLDDKLNKLGI